MKLPSFKYHPNPTETGSVELSTTVCKCCETTTGYIYIGPVYSEEELNDCICPCCIANGDAHKMFGVMFADDYSIGGGIWDGVPDKVKETISTRTPGFFGWQQEKWWSHCGDAAAFLGRAGGSDVLKYGHNLINSLQEDSGLEGVEWDDFCKVLSKDDSPTAYVFQCLHCKKIGGYQDCD